VKPARHNETALLLVAAAIFSAAAIPVLTGFLEPSQPPAVAAVEIGVPRDGSDRARGSDARPRPARRNRDADRRRPAVKRDARRAPARSSSRERPAQPAAPAQPAPAPAPAAPAAPPDDDVSDDGGDGEDAD
jgi:hypothetical protein